MRRTRRQWAAYRLIEEELRNYHKTKREIEELKKDIIESTPPPPDVRVQKPVDKPTERTAIKLLTSAEIKYRTDVIEAIEYVLRGLDEVDLKLVEEYYFRGKRRLYVIDEVFQGAHDTFRLHKNKIVERIAKRLGFDVG